MEESRRADSMIARRIPTLPNRVEMDVLFGSYNEKNTKAVLKAAAYRDQDVFHLQMRDKKGRWHGNTTYTG
jgi:hypothetical protein